MRDHFGPGIPQRQGLDFFYALQAIVKALGEEDVMRFAAAPL